MVQIKIAGFNRAAAPPPLQEFGLHKLLPRPVYRILPLWQVDGQQFRQETL